MHERQECLPVLAYTPQTYNPILMLPSNVGCPNGAATGWKTYSNAACRRIMLSDAARSKRVVHEYANLASD